ncbi:acetolactate synthase large subunit [Bacillus pseudomycoides]|uniref:Acetolactate synthase n=3 Tax=Bacillus pseudomycoides TaxID=64104 RepID=A0A2B5QQH8_9BACI|nr:acetolactate synthase large subunit [Bacillus pseudomycoides]PDY47924.1 acetolactate synthase, large subunit, biosynthetic type [Bacillus pseudomycoides]PEA81099.1 acetolactate synthase, large subunit, biosynthetic type [Bacillus pseudomycoides]PED69343.1 acetolactate synthase, large subunit, biosynthetic type [Bacillus pseudomycoides]PEI34691.1 acetolactate synthase, large subunit, biosynthetic type [Bacillus pseudomycoides]PEJ77724.1 acetolactate synthase, large subunit, biosynthetic type
MVEQHAVCDEVDYGKIKKVTGAGHVIQCLQKLGVTTVFGYPGGAILPVYDALYGSGLKHVLTRHEQAAIHGAEGYARASGEVGVVFATSGPGATNLVTGLADAYMDSIPLVVITGQVATPLIGKDGFQEADVVGITMPVTKHNYQVRDVNQLSRILQEAYYIAKSGRPGPVLIDIPKDIQNAIVTNFFEGEVQIPGYKPRIVPDKMQLESVAEAISKAERPLLYIGGGVIHADATEELLTFARENRIPVVSTLMGLGAYPPGDPLFLGMLGMHGTYAANMAVTECDLLLALGVRFDDRVTGKLELFSPHSKKVHIDIDPAELHKNVTVEYPVVGDVKRALHILGDMRIEFQTDTWVERVKEWKEEYPLSYEQQGGKLKPQHVIALLSELTNGEAIVTTEVGQHQMWAAHFYKAQKPRTFLTSGGLGTMGFGFPAAIGAQLAFEDKLVVCIAGDASFQMNIQELQTIAENNIPVKVFIINNKFLGMVRQWQEMFYENRLSESQIGSPDFVKVAEAYVVKGLRATNPIEAKQAMLEAFCYQGPVVVDFCVEEGENVFPMVPPNKGNHEMIMKRWEE